jgi:hypothetical protein
MQGCSHPPALQAGMLRMCSNGRRRVTTGGGHADKSVGRQNQQTMLSQDGHAKKALANNADKQRLLEVAKRATATAETALAEEQHCKKLAK